MSNATLTPQTPLDEIMGLASANRAQLIESIDNAQSHYEVFKDLGLNPDNIASGESQKKMRMAHKALRLELHPDKVHNHLEGGENEAQIQDLRLLMEDRFKKLQEAYEVLSDPDKRDRYNNTLANQVTMHFEMPQPNKKKEEEEAELPFGSQMYRALVDLKDIEKAFEAYIEEMFPGENAETLGFRATYRGDHLLELSFPNRELAEDFTQRMIDAKMIAPHALQQEQSAEPVQPKNEPVEEEAATGYMMPQLKPPMFSNPAPEAA